MDFCFLIFIYFFAFYYNLKEMRFSNNKTKKKSILIQIAGTNHLLRVLSFTWLGKGGGGGKENICMLYPYLYECLFAGLFQNLFLPDGRASVFVFLTNNHTNT